MTYTHAVYRGGGLCSEHTSLAHAQNAVARYVAMSRGKLTPAAFEIRPIAQQAAVRDENAYRGDTCELCGRQAKPWPRTGKRRYAHKCPHGQWCVRGHRLLGWHQNHATCPECRKVTSPVS